MSNYGVTTIRITGPDDECQALGEVLAASALDEERMFSLGAIEPKNAKGDQLVLDAWMARSRGEVNLEHALPDRNRKIACES